ncbi:MAG TPA: SCO2322 family protein [Marmoricola sp.]|nr:SCO2322 family protein [Marmoricola sp.]
MSRTILTVRRPSGRLWALAALLGLVVALLLPAASASAAAYRYWGYYQLNGTTWSFATKGPAETTPADGSVEGWRFAIGTEGASRFPRATPTFDDLCGDTTAKTGEKRVAVVIDYGRAADSADNSQPPAPVGKCAVVATAASGLEVLSKVADVRSDKGMICGVDGYPAAGCGDAVKTVPAAAKAPDTAVTLKVASAADKTTANATPASSKDDGSHTGTWIGIGVAIVAALAVALVALRRRRTA